MTHAPVLPRTLWFTRCPVPTATGIAADRRWLTDEFARDGIAVRSLQDAEPDADRAAHYTHALPGLFREGGNVPALWARSRGERTRLVGLTWIEERQSILVAPGSGLRGAAALRGSRIALPVHSIAIDFWRAMALRGFEGALASTGLGLADAVPVDVPADGSREQWSAELAALRRGDVDAVYVKGALAVEAARRSGAEVAVELDDLPDPAHRINNGTPGPSPSTRTSWTNTPGSSTASWPSCSGPPTGPPTGRTRSTASSAPRPGPGPKGSRAPTSPAPTAPFTPTSRRAASPCSPNRRRPCAPTASSPRPSTSIPGPTPHRSAVPPR